MADIYTPKIKVDDNGSVQDLNLNAYAVQGKVPSTETTANTIVVRDGQGRIPIASSLQFPTAIPPNASLDDYRGDDKLGWYYASSRLPSFPGSIDRATVLVCKNSNNEYMQVIYGIDDDISLICPYIRIYRNNQWTKWFTILDVTQGDIPSADAFKNIRTTLGTPDVSTFLKVGRQTNWVDNSILAGMESAYNPVLMFGSGDGQAFIAVNRVEHVVSVGGGTGKTYAWNEILATQKFVNDNYVSLAGGDTINGSLTVNGIFYANTFKALEPSQNYVGFITGNNINFGITGSKSTVYDLAQNLIMGVNNISAGKEVILSQTGPINWDVLRIESTTDDEVGMSFYNKAADRRFALGIPASNQLPGYKLAIYDANNAYGYGTIWMALATENWVKDNSLPVQDPTFNGTIFGSKWSGQTGTSADNHAIVIGANAKDYCDFYEHGAVWNFYKSIEGVKTLVAKIQEDGIYSSNKKLATEEWITGQKGQANGIVPLNSEGKIDSTYLPPSEYVQKYAHHLTFKTIIEENDKILTFITFTIVSTQKDEFTALTSIERIGQTLSNQGFNSQERISLAQGVRRRANATSNDYLNDYASVFGVYGTLTQGKWRTVCVAMIKNTAKVTTYSLLWSDFASDVVVPL